MMKRIRDLLFWAHLVTALMVGVVVLIMSVTGVLLTYQRQMQWWADTWGMEAAPPVPGAVRLDTDALAARAAEVVTDAEPSGVTWRADGDAPAAVAFGRGRTVYVNAYTGEVLGEGAAGVRSFFRLVTDWHRWLAMEGERRLTGRAITGAANLGFLFIVLSGIYLWWPRNWTLRALRNVTLFRGGLSGKARDFNWHNVIGIWSAVPLAVVVASAVMISYPWATELVYRVAGDTPSSRSGPPGAGRGGGGSVAGPEGRGGEAPAPVGAANLSVLEARAERQVPEWRSITRQISDGGPEVSFAIDTGDGGQPQRRSTLVLNAGTAEVVRWEPFSSGTPGRRLRSILRFAHTGEVLGLIGQTIAGLVSLGAVVLVWTGFALTWRRFGAWRQRQRRGGVVAVAVERRPKRRRKAGVT